MARLIDADALYNSLGASGNCGSCQLDAYKCQYYNEHTLMEFCERIDDAPTVDAVSLEDYRSMEQTVNKLTKAISENHIEHGHWIDDWDIGCSVCSECDDSFLWEDFNGVREFNYCPTCGAKMNERGDAQ